MKRSSVYVAAGLFLAARLAQHWGKEGFYVALPTAATSNQMHGRVERMLESMGLSRARLMHGMAWVVDTDGPEDEPEFYGEAAQDALLWTAPMRQKHRLGNRNQEHCVVYNMMRLAHILYLWTGETSYADYWERNLYNGLMAQEHPETGMVSYYLPLAPGYSKKWSTPTKDFWCCVGTLVQAPGIVLRGICQQADDSTLRISQFIPSSIHVSINDSPVSIIIDEKIESDSYERPDVQEIRIQLNAAHPLTLQLRIPWWHTEKQVEICQNDKWNMAEILNGLIILPEISGKTEIRLRFRHKPISVPLADDADTVAFMDGPVVLAGLTSHSESILLDADKKPENLLIGDSERSYDGWYAAYRLNTERTSVRLIPLHEIRNETYQVYFPLRRLS